MPSDIKKIGTRAEVMHGKASQTSGGLSRKDLKYNKQGRIVSKKKSALGKKQYNKYKDVMKANEF